jgi:TolB-like protein/DNA-binding winged helix-turn-helix (wHTH) protein/Tfp pilus assembly protein PilF
VSLRASGTLLRRGSDVADADQARIVRFGLFEVDLRVGELRKNGIKIKLQEQPFQVLVTLLQHAGDVVPRSDLRQQLWPKDTFVDFDHSLNAAVKRLRDALGESAESPVFIETLARRGYRFNGSVSLGAAPVAAQNRPRTFPPYLAQAMLKHRVLGLTVVALVAALIWFGALRSRTGASSHVIESLAVLPLENLSRDPEQEYFSDGMTDAMIAQLSKIGTLRVISRTSAMRYKGTTKSLPEIARELNVDGVIEGSVLRSGNRVRIMAQLINGHTDQHLWADTYERDLGDILKLQSDVAQAVAQQVRIQLTPAQQARLRSAPAVDPQAYEAYLRGSTLRPEGTEVTIKQAQVYFEEAVRRDPRFALAYVGLADCYLDLGTYRWLAPQEAYQHGSEAIQKALQLDQTLAEAHSSLGYLNWQYSWDWQTAEKELRYALDLNPSYVDGHIALLWYLAWSGRHDEALAEMQKFRSLDPAYPLTSFDESGVYYHQRDYKSLIEAGKKSVLTNPNLWSGHYFLAVGYEGSGQLQQAVLEYQRAVDLSQRDSDTTAGLAHAYATMGNRPEAQKILGELQRQSKISYASPYMIATIYAGLGQKDRALQFLERAYQERSPDLAYFIKADLRIDSLRSDPRFQDLMHRMNFPQ